MTTPTKLNVTVTVNMPVVLIDYGTHRHTTRANFNWVVTRVTPSGKFEARMLAGGFNGMDLVRYFNAQGYEVTGGLKGTLKSYGRRISTDVAYWEARTQAEARARTARDAINAVKEQNCRETWSRETMLERIVELEALVAATRTAAEAR